MASEWKLEFELSQEEVKQLEAELKKKATGAVMGGGGGAIGKINEGFSFFDRWELRLTVLAGLFFLALIVGMEVGSIGFGVAVGVGAFAAGTVAYFYFEKLFFRAAVVTGFTPPALERRDSGVAQLLDRGIEWNRFKPDFYSLNSNEQGALEFKNSEDVRAKSVSITDSVQTESGVVLLLQDLSGESKKKLPLQIPTRVLVGLDDDIRIAVSY